MLHDYTPLKKIGTSRINTEAAFLRIFTVAFLLFLVPAGGSNTAGAKNSRKAIMKLRT